MLGGEFVTHDRPQQAALEVVGPDFPGIGALGGSLAMYEEWYALKNFAPDLHVILVQQTADMIGGCYRRPPFPVTWARMHGKGRVFYTSLGHCEHTWTHSGFQQIALAGLAWVLGRVDADVTPNIHQSYAGCGSMASRALLRPPLDAGQHLDKKSENHQPMDTSAGTSLRQRRSETARSGQRRSISVPIRFWRPSSRFAGDGSTWIAAWLWGTRVLPAAGRIWRSRCDGWDCGPAIG